MKEECRGGHRPAGENTLEAGVLVGGLRADLAVADRDKLALRRHAIDHDEGQRRAGGEQVRVRRELRNVQLLTLGLGAELDHALTHVHAVRRETSADEHNLGVVGLVGIVEVDSEAVATVVELVGKVLARRTVLVVEVGVPALNAVFRVELLVVREVHVRVRARDQDRRVGQQRRTRVVETANTGGADVRPALTRRLARVVQVVVTHGVVAERVTHRLTGLVGVVRVAGRTSGDTVAEPELAVRQDDELTHGAALGEIVGRLVLRVVRQRRDLLTRVARSALRDHDRRATLVAPLRVVHLHTTAEQDRLAVVVARAKGKQRRTTARGVHTRGHGDVGKTRLAVAVPVPEDRLAVRLHEQLAVAHEEGVRVHRQGHRALQKVDVDRLAVALAGVVLERGLVRALRRDVATITHTTDDGHTAVAQRLHGGVPALLVHLVRRLVDPLARLVRARRQEAQGVTTVVRAVGLRTGLGVLALVRDGLVTTGHNPAAVTERHTASTERVRADVHGAVLVRVVVILDGPRRVAVDVNRVVLDLVENVRLTRGTEEHHLAAHTRVADDADRVAAGSRGNTGHRHRGEHERLERKGEGHRSRKAHWKR